MEHFDLCVIGSGSGNSLIDERFDALKVALIDRGTFGGTCLNVGCIPTKMFVCPADYAISPLDAKHLDVDLELRGISFARARDRIFGRIDPIVASGLEWRQSSPNVTFFPHQASFIDERTLRVGDAQITADAFVLATGSHPVVPPLPGTELPEVRRHIHTSDTVMRLTELPQRIVIVGGGYVAAEFAHIFSGFGSSVTVVQRSASLLRREDADISRRFTDLLAARIPVRLNQQVVAIEPDKRGVVVITEDANGVEYSYPADVVLIAAGRHPNSESLNPQAAGIEVDEDGYVVVDALQRTSTPHIWALGDVCSPSQLKHVANHEMRVVQHNLTHPHELIQADHRFVPHAVFSHPQVAAVGATEQQLQASGADYVSAVHDYGDVAHGWATEDHDHFVKLLGDRESGLLLGAHIIGPQAAILLQPLVQAMSFGLDIFSMARGQYWIHPALTEVVENALLSLHEARTRPVAELGEG
ncbi:MAG TPA: mycothione reductase [Propionibacteriaceae bacterium]|nr:mycothione reductase [Propionibacteriaceae bacterium]